MTSTSTSVKGTMCGNVNSSTFVENTDNFHGLESTFFASFFVSILTVTSLIINGLIVLLFFKKAELRHTPSNRLVLNLIATNCIASIFILPSLLVSSVTQKWILGDVGCQLFGIISTSMFSSWLLTLASLSIDRFHFIVNPLSYPINMTLFKTNVILCLLWSYSIITGIVPLFVSPAFQYYTMEHTCTIDWSGRPWYSVHVLSVSYLLPLLIQIWCYGHIVLAAKRQALFGRRLSRVAVVPIEITRIIRETSAARAIKKTILVLGSCIVLFTPYSIYIILRTVGSRPSFIGFWLYLIALTSILVYPTLFVLRAKGLKKEFKELIRTIRLSRNAVQEFDITKDASVRGCERRSTKVMLFTNNDAGLCDSETSAATQPYQRRQSIISERRVSWNLQPCYIEDQFILRGAKINQGASEAHEETGSDFVATSVTYLPGQVP